MLLKFKHYQYQTDATNALVNCFAGQTKGHRKEIIGRSTVDKQLFGTEVLVDEIFSNKKLELSSNELLKNIQEIQKEQGLPVSKQLDTAQDRINLTVEMETGTGKTYVYTKSMFELNKQYGWSKFIVMVPSVAIREGVHKSIELTAEHFQEEYGKKIRFFIYDSQNKSNLINIKNFANTSNIEVIIMNYQAFSTNSKDQRKIFQKLDQTNSRKPIDIIKQARPILIIDEPQRFGSTAENMLSEFDPLFIVRYSATHKQEYNKIYRLDAIDAFNHKLVKRISVKGIEVVGNSGTSSYLFLDRLLISPTSQPIAYLEFETKQKNGIKKILRKVKGGDNLYELSGELSEYKGYIIKADGIDGRTNTVHFTNGLSLSVGQTLGDVDEKHVRRIQIREAIRSHIEKERIMYDKGIKVLTLFFIDEVAKYRKYDNQGNEMRGEAEYEKVFEEEYRKAIEERNLFEEEYNIYLDKFTANQIHQGYFSIDKKGKFEDSSGKGKENISDDASAYDLIMKNKEQLLSFDEPTRFIFSHSALREGWDNPNVFQICTLKHSQSTISKRQEIGRGLRICVNRDGQRMDHATLEGEFFDYNTLTVIASESYDTFAKELQKEIVESLSDRPVILSIEVLSGRVLKNGAGETFEFTNTLAMDLVFDFKMKGYVDEEYRITDKLVQDIEENKIELPAKFEQFKQEINDIIIKIHGTANYKASIDGKADNIDLQNLEPNENFAKKEFQALRSKIKGKTVYEVDFDTQELIKNSLTAIDKNLEVRKVIIHISTGSQKEHLKEHELKTGTSMEASKKSIERTSNLVGETKYDLVGEIAKGATVTRGTVVKILSAMREDKFRQFKLNPEDFIRQVVRLINEQKASTLINSITYSKTTQSYSDDIFTINQLKGSLKDNILEVKKHIYQYVKTDSATERTFAQHLESDEIKVYAKLPNDFKIPTPIGNYNPDRAIVFDDDRMKYVYFIAETKGSMSDLQLKKAEELKIEYAKKHFEALGHSNIKYDMVNSYQDMLDKVL